MGNTLHNESCETPMFNFPSPNERAVRAVAGVTGSVPILTFEARSVKSKSTCLIEKVQRNEDIALKFATRMDCS